MTTVNEQVLGALLNRKLSHTAFRIYVAIAVSLEDRSHEEPVAFSVPKLRAVIPGVRGKPFGLTALGLALGELADLDLIDVYGPLHSTKSVIIGPPGGKRGRKGPPPKMDLHLERADRAPRRTSGNASSGS